DASFDGDGKAIFSDMFRASNVALQFDGKIVVSGNRNGAVGFQVARLTPAGALDTSFDQDGWTNDTDIRLGYAHALLVQSDGKIVVCGTAGQSEGKDDFAVTRYNANGARDFSFGNGIVFIGFGGKDFCSDAAQQADGKLVIAGNRFESNLSGLDDDFAIARLHSTGQLDSGFDNDGKLTTGFGHNESAYAIAIQPDGKIVALGNDSNDNTSYLARYNSNGSLDKTFDGDGKLSIPVDKLWDLAIQPDGKLVALGYHISPDGDKKFALYRLLANGAPDTGFDDNGNVRFDFGGADEGLALALQPDGRILAAGTKGNIAILVRVWPDGRALDTGGRQTHGHPFPPGANELTSSLAVQSDGKLLVAGELRSPVNTWSQAFVSRFLADGQIDSSFGYIGTSPIYEGAFSAAHAIAVQSDGKIVIAGYATGRGNTGSGVTDDFLIARLLPSGAGDPSFGTNGVYRLDFTGGADRANGLALTSDGKIVVAGSAWYNGRQIWGVARLTTSGAPDPTFTNGAGPGKALLDFNPNSAANVVALQPDGKILLGGKTGGEDFVVARLLTNGALDPNFGPNGAGYNITNMGGADAVVGLGLAPNGWIYAAGFSWRGGTSEDFALAQYQPNGTLPQCPSGQTCAHWPGGLRFINMGGSDSAYSLVLRGDNQLIAAGCSDGQMAAAQVNTTDISAPLLFKTDFVGEFECANGVQFSDASKSKIVLAGWQVYNNDHNVGLARFQTTPQALASMSPSNLEANPGSEPGAEQEPSGDVDATSESDKEAPSQDASTTTDDSDKEAPSQDVSTPTSPAPTETGAPAEDMSTPTTTPDNTEMDEPSKDVITKTDDIRP
ncbi:MAG TPA: hypothetical protein VFX76_21535, partial [Roseiflexaceae bacterium]|nr:hypothetical protein [Roseiflexaceae bacterium]